MKILILTNKVPYPARDGSSIAMASMIDGLLKNGAELSLLSLNTAKHYKQKEDIEKELPARLRFYQVYTDNRITAGGAALNLISGSPYHVSRFRVKEFSQKLSQLLENENYDVVQLEGLSMAVYYGQIRQLSTAKIALRAHNVESQIWQRHIAHEPDYFRKTYLRLQVKRLRDFEKKIIYDVDALVSITEEDLQNFRQMVRSKKGISIACGVNLNQYRPCAANKREADISYLASFDWLPNRQGAWWFVEEVWPIILEKRPHSRFVLGGRHMPEKMKNLAVTGITVQPDVPDMRQFICNARLAVVPLLAGSGMRIKVLENMALGVCQVSTSMGAEGIAVESGKDILLADTPAEMAQAVINLLDDDQRIAQIGKNARKKIENQYTNQGLGKQLLEFYETEVC